MKWQLYNKEEYSEIYFRGDTPRSFSEWETVVQENPKCIYWLSPNAFLSHGYDDEWLSSVTTAKRNFPQCYLQISTNQHSFDVWATTEMEAFRTLYEMSLYDDFPSCFKGLEYLPDDTTITLPTTLLKMILQEAVNHVVFHRIDFVSEYAGRVLASTGRSKTITFHECAFQPPAEEAFVDGMLSKADKNSGWTGLHLIRPLPFSSDEVLVRLIQGEVLADFKFELYGFSERLQDSLRDSLQLQTLALELLNFMSSFDHFAGFVRSLHSRSLRSLKFYYWDFRRAAFPVEIFHKLLLTELYVGCVFFTEAGWKSIRQELPKCKTLEKLEVVVIGWCGCYEKEFAEVQVAVEFAELLKDSPNILVTNTREFFYDNDEDEDDDNAEDDELYTTHIAPILQHNRLIKNLTILKRKENYQVRGFLVAEAVGRQFANKPSCCYTVLKANVDVLVAYLASDEKAQQVVSEAVHASETVMYNPLSTTGEKQDKRQTPSNRKR